MKNIAPIAFESLGVRSMATFIQTYNLNILIDPSAALAPRRYGLPPHIIEVKELQKAFDKISSYIKDSDVIIITHYHYDHHDPGRFLDLELFKGKEVIVKDPKNNINTSQRIRAHRFLSRIEKLVKRLAIGDNRELSFSFTRINISYPVTHGIDSQLGYVLEICIYDKDLRVLFTSDIEGCVNKSQLEFMLRCNPDIAIVDGPPIYLQYRGYSSDVIQKSIENISAFILNTNVNTVIIDHHLVRSIDYVKYYKSVMETIKSQSEKSFRILTAAEYLGLEPRLLEARRRELYSSDPRCGLDLLKSLIRKHEMEISLGEEK